MSQQRGARRSAVARVAETLPVRRLALLWRRDPDYLCRLARDCGDLVRVRLFGREVILLSDQALIETVLGAEHSHFDKGKRHVRARAVVGPSLQLLGGAEHRAQRRLLAMALAGTSTPSTSTSLAMLVKHWLAQWHGHEQRDLAAAMCALATAMITHMLCTRLPASFNVAALDADLALLVRAFRGRRPLRAARRVEQAITLMLAAAPDAAAPDLVAALRQAGAADSDLRAALRGLLLGGRESIAAVLTWSLVLLSQHQGAAARVRAEVDAVAEPWGASNLLAQLPFTRMVICEAMRLYPPAPTLLRRCVAPTRLGSLRLHVGALLLISPYVMQRDPRYYQTPDAFVPERWASDAAARLPRYAFFPFGGGPRRCVAERLAWNEALLALATIVRHASLRFSNAAGAGLAAGVTLQPADALLVSLTGR